ncbi:DUF4159 domain-containing protein [Candidatus Pacearchaeota archaeon]|nr:DUF4159 domain-containing protein [Candidatus Pacearchaeota archaeon]
MGFLRNLSRGATFLGLVGILNFNSANAQTLYTGDGSNEPGFVPPPASISLPPPPPARMSSGESFIPYPPPPVVPQARSEKKNPPKPPVLMTKIRQGMPLEWNAFPDDANGLLRSLKNGVDANFSLEVKSLEEISSNPEQNPILFRGGHYHFSFTTEQRKKLREYLLNGGTIIFDTSLGSKPFYDSVRQEITTIFPETSLQRLNLDHPVFHSYYDLDNSGSRVDTWIEGLTINCRTFVFLSRWGLGAGWSGDKENTHQAYSVDFARKLGMNISAYSTAQRAWQRNMINSLSFRDIDSNKSGKFSLAQAIYNGEWKTRHKGISILLSQFNKRTQVPVSFSLEELRFSDPRIFDHPVIYLTGHESFELSDREKANVRDYLIKGGIILAEACCGRKAFDSSFRKMISQVLPAQVLLPVPLEETIFNLPNKIREVGTTPALANLLKSSRTTPRLEAISLQGRHAVIYSPYGLAGGWELSQNPYSLGYDDSSSLLLGENLLFNCLIE